MTYQPRTPRRRVPASLYPDLAEGALAMRRYFGRPMPLSLKEA